MANSQSTESRAQVSDWRQVFVFQPLAPMQEKRSPAVPIASPTTAAPDDGTTDTRNLLARPPKAR